jgi:hypothetical protein
MPLGGRQFRAVFKNGAGTVTSKAVTLTVTAPPVVTQQPVAAKAKGTLAAGYTFE